MRKLILATLLTLAIPVLIIAQSSAFTYQGKLSEAGTRANGPFDFTLRLFSIDTGGTQIGSDIILDNVQVLDGIFTVTLDFGSSPFTGGTGNYLEILVRPGNSTGPYTLLTPRQPIVSVPYSVQTVHAAQADTALNADALGGTPANQFVQTNDPRMSDARVPTPGSPDYIQNTATPQATSANFNISGNGKAGVFDAATQYNIGGNRIIGVPGTSNLFAGQDSGIANTTGNSNSFFGRASGQANTTGSSNSFFGGAAGLMNIDGTDNSFFGVSSGRNNSSGSNNAFIGHSAGFGTTIGGNNSFFGFRSGYNNQNGQFNTFVGASSGQTSISGGGNTLLGYNADVLSSTVSNATAIGFRASVAQANSLVLGSINGVNGCNGTNCGDTNVGIGTTAPSTRLHVVGNGLFNGDLTVTGTLNATLPTNSGNYVQNTTTQQASSNFNISGTGTASIFSAATQYNIGPDRVLSVAGSSNVLAGVGAGAVNTGTDNAFFGALAGNANTDGGSNAFFGAFAGLSNTTGSDNDFYGSLAGRSNTTGVQNAFFGTQAGKYNTTGDANAFFGFAAGSNTTTGINNDFFGWFAGFTNTIGSNNSALGAGADFSANNLTNATAIGARSLVGQSNSLVLGSINGVNGATADTNVGIGTTAPTQRLHVVGNSLFNGDLTVTGALNANIGPGNANYIQNTTAQQSASNFNISGTGTASIFSAGTQYNIGANRVLSVAGTGNTFAGVGAGSANGGVSNAFFGNSAGLSNTSGGSNAFFGASAGASNTKASNNAFFGVNAGLNNTAGTGNAFFGSSSGKSNTTANFNSFFGDQAGQMNTTGAGNAFFGASSGKSNTTANFNSFFGDQAGIVNTTGAGNAFFGGGAGQSNTTASGNAFFGTNAGFSNTTASSNAFFGTAAGTNNTTGTQNAFFGDGAGQTNVSGSNNSALGKGADFSANNLTNATAVGAFSLVGQSNSLVLGSINGVNNATADTNVGIGTTAPTQRLHVVGNGLFTGTVRANGGMYIPNPNTLVITSPNGFCWGITVSNSGVLSAFPVAPCP